MMSTIMQLQLFCLEDKSHVYTDVGYISLFDDFESLHWACGCAAVRILYNAFKEAS